MSCRKSWRKTFISFNSSVFSTVVTFVVVQFIVTEASPYLPISCSKLISTVVAIDTLNFDFKQNKIFQNLKLNCTFDLTSEVRSWFNRKLDSEQMVIKFFLNVFN
jgi:hypothetical protein